MSSDNITTFNIKINFNNEINGYILDVSNNKLDTLYITYIIDFVISNYQLYNIKYVNISHNNFELNSTLGLNLLDKILYCYTNLHIGINASHGLQLKNNDKKHVFSEEEKQLFKNKGVFV